MATLLAACAMPPAADPSRLSTGYDTYAGVDTIVRQVVASMPNLCRVRSKASLAFQLGHEPFLNAYNPQTAPNHDSPAQAYFVPRGDSA